MAKSKITIQFLTPFVAGDIIRISRRRVDDPLNFVIEGETYTNSLRYQSFFIQIAYPGYADYTNFVYFFHIDYNIYGIYKITTDANAKTATLEFYVDGWEFYDFFATNGHAVAVIENEVLPTFTYTNDDPVFSQAANPCKMIKVAIPTSEIVKKVYRNGTLYLDNNTINPVEILFPRGVPYFFTLENASGVQLHYGWDGVTVSGAYYDFLSVGNITVDVTKSLSGATVMVKVINTNKLILEYSLNSIDWQASNIFTGQAIGDYTVYVRDNFGCSKSVNYSVDELGSREPFLFISEANSISFKERVDFDECGVYRNDENSLSFENKNMIIYCDDVLFQTCDTTRIQIKSNYKSVIPILRRSDGFEVDLTLEKLTNNLNRFSKLDAIIYEYSIGVAGIYFQDGFTYDEFGVKLDAYTLNGNLPDLAIIGQQITISGFGTFYIKDIIYDSNINKKAILIDYNFVGEQQDTLVWSVYDLLQYEVYEFKIDWNSFGVGTYDVVILNSDDKNGSVTHMSENISIKDVHEDTVAVRYYNDNNRDVFYKFGIEHFIRLPLLYKKAIPKDVTEIHITDDSTDVTTSFIYEADEFSFDAVNQTTMRKIAIALSCQFVFIQNIGYAKEGGISSTNSGNSNDYYVTATLIKKGMNYTNNRIGSSTGAKAGLEDNIGFKVPAFLKGNSDNLIKI